MEVFGVGLRYYPFCEYFGLESGAEFFKVQADVMADFKFFKREINDSVYGYGSTMVLISELLSNFLYITIQKSFFLEDTILQTTTAKELILILMDITLSSV